MPATKSSTKSARPKRTPTRRSAPARSKVAAQRRHAEGATPAPKLAPANPKRSDVTYAVGRRKTAVARVWIWQGSGAFTVNNHPVATYFPTIALARFVTGPLVEAGVRETIDVNAVVIGGGKHGQATSVRHGLARALVRLQADLRPMLKRAGFLTRDPRVKERKKYGLKRARRAPQWQKR